LFKRGANVILKRGEKIARSLSERSLVTHWKTPFSMRPRQTEAIAKSALIFLLPLSARQVIMTG